MATPVKIAFATVLVSQTLALILMFPLGHAGLTLSTSIGACFNAGLLFWFLQQARHLRAPGRLAAVRGEARRRAVRARRRAAVARRSGVVLARGIALGEGRPARRRVRRGRGRLFRRAVAAGIPPRRFQPPGHRGGHEPGRLQCAESKFRRRSGIPGQARRFARPHEHAAWHVESDPTALSCGAGSAASRTRRRGRARARRSRSRARARPRAAASRWPRRRTPRPART